jgi:hypothetical protein
VILCSCKSIIIDEERVKINYIRVCVIFDIEMFVSYN